MGHFSMEIYAPSGSNLSGNQHPNQEKSNNHSSLIHILARHGGNHPTRFWAILALSGEAIAVI